MNLPLRGLATSLFLFSATGAAAAPAVHAWLTTPDRQSLLAEQEPGPAQAAPAGAPPLEIVVSGAERYQTMDGFGFALTGGSAQNLLRMSAPARAALLRELFTTGPGGIGISYLRVSIGASDLNARVFSYDDQPPGSTDPTLAHFSLSDDRQDVVPVLKEILALAPRIKILGSPWSAPAWMKTNGQVQGGLLRESCYAAYAAYFVKYIQAMAAEGIAIDAITVQNEPFNDGNTPSMQMFPKQEAAFIRDHLGPAFRAAGIRTKIVLYDHNCDAPEYPVSILTDPAARAFVDGSGFHLYAGPITALSVVHDRFPDKRIYFTEQAVGEQRRGFTVAAPVARILVGATRNWSRNVLLWNLASDPQFRPHTDNGGCTGCMGAVTLDGDTVERKLAYYVIAHASRFVPAGSVRIGSTEPAGLADVAFRTPTGGTVLIVANPGATDASPLLVEGGLGFTARLPAGSVATYTWIPSSPAP